MFDSNILAIYEITQNLVTKDYIIILDHAKGGSFNDWIKNKIHILHNIIDGLKEVHENKLIHMGIMGLCEEVNNVDKSKIYEVLPYIAPDVLRGNPYTQQLIYIALIYVMELDLK
ncbi:kinase-like domain-containing protein [Rhizophagus clarus]|uniref:Kinase-like domain-containing protein n=1 Tax=Rhizophagus clarus TaxID=94130 RepID=A0A8H3LYF1_9GLOM|nr:kinase-like domain-containing protein [Rhizophagus clarus]